MPTFTWFCEDSSNIADYLVVSLNRMSSNNNAHFNFNKPIPEAFDALGRRLTQFVGLNLSRRMNNQFDIPSTVNSIKSYANEHPIFVMILALMATLCAIPILAFVCFVVATLGLTFMGFIFVEGTLLTVGTFLLSGVLFVVGFVALGFSAVVAITWFVVNKAFGVMSNASNKLSIRQRNKSPIRVPNDFTTLTKDQVHHVSI